MTQSKYLIFALIFFVLAVFIAIFLVSQMSSLQERATTLQQEVAKLQREKATLNEQVAAQKEEQKKLTGKVEEGETLISRGAKYQVDLLGAIDGDREYIVWLRTNVVPEKCRDEATDFCRFLESYGELLELRQNNLVYRLSARNIDFEELKAGYEKMRDKNQGMETSKIWGGEGTWRTVSGRTRNFFPDYSDSFAYFSNEGIAYANLKLGSLDAASSAIQDAGRSTTAKLTEMKIMCAQKKDSGEVQQKLDKLHSRLTRGIDDEDVSERLKGKLQTNLDFIRRDEELRAYCGYANLKFPEMSR